MELLAPEPPIELYDPAWPILTLPEQLPPAKLLYDSGRHGDVANSLLAGGVAVRGATVTNSVLSSNAHVDDGTVLDEAVVLPNARIGTGCRLRRVVIDAGVEIPDGTSVGWAESSRANASPRVELLSRGSPPPAGNDLRSVA